MASILLRQIDAIGPVVGRDDDADTIEDVMFAQMLLVDPQYIRRCCGIDLEVIIEFEAIDSPRSRASLIRNIVDFRKLLNRPIICVGDTSRKFHGADGALNRLQQRILSNTFLPAQD